ncbi:MAG: choice-of-anchor Q domain-containing protein, partial [Pirellulales bacterium]
MLRPQFSGRLSLSSRRSSCSRRASRGKRARARALGYESLEQRRLLAITVDTLVDELDGSIVDGDVSLRDALELAPPGETIDFDASLDGGTILLTLGELAIADAITIDATALSDGLTVDASGNDPTPEEDNGDGSRVFNVDDADDSPTLEVAIRGLTLSGGDVSANGGAIFNQENLTVTNSTISANSARQVGGGIWAFEGAVSIDHSILVGNTDGGTAPDVRPGTGTLTVKYGLIGDNTGTGLVEAPVGAPDADGNLIGGPIHGIIDPMLAPLADNGAPTQTHALMAGSPAIDAGDPAALAGLGDVPLFDQRGAPFGRVAGGRIDMGAHEKQDLAVEIVAVATPRIVPVGEVTIQFSSEVTGFDRGDLQLSLNGGVNLLTDSQTLTTSDNRTYVLAGLADITTGSGYYSLSLVSSGSGIVQTSGGPLDAGDTSNWAMGRLVLELTVDTLVDEADGSLDDGDVSLRDALAAAAPGETIGFDASLDGGTILLTLGELAITKALVIDASPLTGDLTIDASGNDPTPDEDDGDGSRVFNIDDGDGNRSLEVAIRGVTLSGGD